MGRNAQRRRATGPPAGGGVYSYSANGDRQPFNPQATHAHLARCILCERPVEGVGVFVPDTDETRTAVLRLRSHAVRPRSTPCLSYGLCAQHATDPGAVVDQVEDAILAAAARVTVQ